MASSGLSFTYLIPILPSFTVRLAGRVFPSFTPYPLASRLGTEGGET